MALLPNNERETDLGPYTQLDLRVLGPFYEVMSVPSGFCRGSLPRPFILASMPTLMFAGQQQIQMTSSLTHPFQPFLPTWGRRASPLYAGLPLVLSNSKPTDIITLVISGSNPQKTAFVQTSHRNQIRALESSDNEQGQKERSPAPPPASLSSTH